MISIHFISFMIGCQQCCKTITTLGHWWGLCWLPRTLSNGEEKQCHWWLLSNSQRSTFSRAFVPKKSRETIGRWKLLQNLHLPPNWQDDNWTPWHGKWSSKFWPRGRICQEVFILRRSFHSTRRRNLGWMSWPSCSKTSIFASKYSIIQQFSLWKDEGGFNAKPYQ